MIQRIQTVYWFIAAVLAALMIVFPWFSVSTSEGIFSVSTNGLILEGQSNALVGGLLLLIYCIIYMVLNVAIIALFKRRVLQARMSTIATFMALGFYVLFALFRFMFVESEILHTTYSWPVILPLIGAILDYMGCRAAVKDEQKVRSLDRIR